MSSAATKSGMHQYPMDMPSSARFDSPNVPGRQYWGISQLKSPGNTLLPWEHTPFTLHPTELLRGNLDEDNALSLHFDSTSVDVLDADWTSDDITANVSASLIPDPTRGPTMPQDAGFRATSADRSTKSTTELEKLEGITCTCSKKEESGTDDLRCPWKDCKNPGPFSRKYVLVRHVKTQHENPRSFKCPNVGCDKLFNRKDNMVGHIRSSHGNGC